MNNAITDIATIGAARENHKQRIRSAFPVLGSLIARREFGLSFEVGFRVGLITVIIACCAGTCIVFVLAYGLC